MKFKKYNFINSIFIFIIYIFGIFSNVGAINYKFDVDCTTQTLSNNDQLTINLNLVDGYSRYLRLHPFVCELKFNKNILDFGKVIPSKNIRSNDICVENSNDYMTIKFNPNEPRTVDFSNNFAEIFKTNLICKSKDGALKSYFSINVVDSETGETVLNKFTEIAIKNATPNGNNRINTNSNTKSFSNRAPADCHLKSITPSFGSLNPSFNPNILKYKMEVPKEIQEIYFDITPISENTDVRVSKHRLGAPGTLTYINITSKNQNRIMSYLIEVKRNINFSNPSANDSKSRTNSHSKTKGNSNHERENNSGKSNRKIKKRKRKNNHKKNGSSGNTDNEDDDENEALEDEENPEDEENNVNIAQNRSSNLENNKIYWIIAFAILILSIATYLYFKKKSKSSKSSKDSLETDINNFVEK